MRKGIKLVAVSVMIAAVALVAVGTVSAQGPRGGRGGMMGGGYGPGGFGPGMMGNDGGYYGPGMMGRGFGPGMMGGFGYGMMMDEDSMWTVLADLTGLEPQALWEEVAASDSIAAVLEAHDVTVEAATEAILAAHAEGLAAAVEAGNLTQEEADAMQVLMSGRITAMLTATRPTVDSSTAPWGGRMWDDNGWHHPFFNGTAPDSSTPDTTVPEATPEVNAS